MLAVLLAAPAPSNTCGTTPPGSAQNGQTLVLAGCGSTIVLGGDSYTVYNVPRLTDGETVLGQYTSNLSVAAYLLNGTDLTQLYEMDHPTTPPPHYYWSCGPALLCNLSVPVPGSPIQPYLVLENLHPANASIEWTKTLSLYY
ncbi:MAG: hypothetical protein ACREC5_08725, partial [Thermoplasmata archaeon]